MKKSFLIVLSLVLLIYMALIVNAHSGKTDGSGGHTDHSSGEYHYHHGYSAHDHYDMDGDGTLDCPYNFYDNTGINSGNNSTSNTKIVTKKVPYIPSWIYWVIGILVVVILILGLIIKSKCNEISFQMNKMKAEETQVKDGLESLQRLLKKHHGKNWLCILCKAPNGDYIGTDGLPHSSDIPLADRYTFFLGGQNARYHHASCRYCRISMPVNAYSLQKSRAYQPCSLCHPKEKLPNVEWVDRYKKHYNFLSKYIDVTKRVPNTENHESNNLPNAESSAYINWRD